MTHRTTTSRAGTPSHRSRRAARAAATALLCAGLLIAASQEQRPGSPAAPSANPPMSLVADEAGVKATESEAFAEAVATGQPVEIGAYRGERQEVFANPDGTLTSREHAQPVRIIGENGQWVPIDSTLVTAADGSVVPKASTLGVRLSGGGTGPLIEVERAGRVLGLAWPGTLPTPTLSEDTATYSEVLPGVDLVVTVGPGGFSHVLVIKTPAAAANPAVTALRFNLDSEGLNVATTTDGGVAAVDAASGGTVFEAPAPVMWDSREDAPETAASMPLAATTAGDDSTTTEVNSVPVAVSVESGTLTLVPDSAMLTDPNTQWPVYVDPVWESTSASSWAMVDSGYPRQPYWKFSDTEGVGRCPKSSGRCNNSGVKRIFYAMPTPFSGKNILSAEFLVTMTHTYDTTARDVSLYLANSGIGPSTTWNNQPGLPQHLDTKAPTGRQGTCTPTNHNVAFNAISAVQQAAAYGWSTTTLALRANDEGNSVSWKRFCGNGILSVRYNRAPDQPAKAGLASSPGGVCANGDSRPYVSSPPTVYMMLSDPDSAPWHVEQVYGAVSLSWVQPGGTRQNRFFETGWKASGSPFQVSLPADLPENTVMSWQVRASDGTEWGPWSATCEFVYDHTRPEAPDVDSPEYLPRDASEATAKCADDDQWRGSVGVYGTFTFDSVSSDAVTYRYGFNNNPSPNTVIAPATPGGPASVAWMPEKEGPNIVTVEAVDRAGLSSTVASCVISVGRRQAVGEWSLGEKRGETSAADLRGGHPAIPGPGATFGALGPGCVYMSTGCEIDRAVTLTGEADSYLSATTSALVDTEQGFAVAAWVRLTDTSRDHVAVSQDGSGEPGFTLGYSATTKKWTFGTPVSDISALGGWSVASTADAKANAWTHLVGVYDPVKRTLAMYVNGKAQATAARRSAWKSRGAVQIGRKVTKSGYTSRWVGDLADVTLLDRVMVPDEITDLSQVRPVRKAYWQLNTASNGVSPELGGGEGLRLSGGAKIRTRPGYTPLIGAGDLQLDGVDDVASTSGPIVTTDESFTVSFRVRVAALPTRPMAVISQAGTKNSGFAVRLTPERWELTVPSSDATGAPAVTVYDPNPLPVRTAQGQSVAVVYNAFTHELRLYAGGELAATAVGVHATPWLAGGGLQVGRALVDGSWKDHFAGTVDDLRVYAGAVDPSGVNRLADANENPRL